MEVINSFFQNVKDKLTSPFFGSLVFVMLVHHWVFWYTLFNFDKDCTRTEKIAILQLISKNEFGRWNILHDILWALLAMIAGYIIIFGTRALAIWYDLRLMPWLTNNVSSQTIIDRSLYDEVVKERGEYAEKYEVQRKNVREISKDFDRQHLQIEEKDLQILDLNDQTSALQKQTKEGSEKITDLQGMLAEQIRQSDQVNRDLHKQEKAAITLTRAISEYQNELDIAREISQNINSIKNWKKIGDFPTLIRNKIVEMQHKGLWSEVLSAFETLSKGYFMSELNR